MAYMHVHGIGNLTKDAEFITAGDSRKGTFRIGVSARYKDREGNTQARQSFFACEIWGKLAETFESMGSLKKGTRVNVIGHFRTDRFKDTEGKDQERDYLYLSEVDLLSPKATDDSSDA